MTSLPDPTPEHLSIARQMRAKARRGWYIGDMETLNAFGARRWTTARTTPELMVLLLLSRDKMHHSVGWWRNAEYEYCWHLSLSARDRLAYLAASRDQDEALWARTPYEEVPRAEVRYWTRLIFGGHVNKLWNEPGGTDPRLSKEEAHRNSLIWHLRLFLDPETMEPFIPTGEVYDLTRWIDGLTPEKVDR